MEYIVRMPANEDKEGMKIIWKTVFGESDSFVNWFFENRYQKAYATCLIYDDRVASSMQSNPFNLRIRGRIIESAMLAGVSTYSDYRGMGFMSYVFKAHMKQLRDAGVVLVPHTPANTPTFFSKGHYPVSENKKVVIPAYSGLNAGTIDLLSNLKEEYGNMFACYSKWSLPYSGIVARTMADFSLKMADYASDEAKGCLIRDKNDNIKAYGVFFTLDDHIHVEELAFDSNSSLDELLLSISSLGLEVRAKMPVDTFVSIKDIQETARFQGVLGVANIQRFLKAMFPVSPVKDLSVEITDRIVDENNGVFNLDGTVSSKKPAFTIEAGRLAQVLCGFRSLSEQHADSYVQVHDEGLFTELDSILPKERCFIVDEY